MVSLRLAALGLCIASSHAWAPRSRTTYRTSPHMSIAVFGATGGTGGEAAYQALARGEAVTALVRDKSRVVIPQGSGGSKAGQPLAGINVVEGTVTNQADVDKVFEGQDVSMECGVRVPTSAITATSTTKCLAHGLHQPPTPPHKSFDNSFSF